MAGHLLDESASGVFVIAATPFADNGALDLGSLERLIGFYIDAGVHGITILGMMGEAHKLTADEARLVIRSTLRQVAGEVPVVVGVSSPGLATLAALTSDAMSAGAAAVMVAPPAGLATDEQIEGYLHQLCGAIGEEVPLVLQDYPQATGVHLSVALLDRLVDDLPQIKILKHEDCPGLGKLSRIRSHAERDAPAADRDPDRQRRALLSAGARARRRRRDDRLRLSGAAGRGLRALRWPAARRMRSTSTTPTCR